MPELTIFAIRYVHAKSVEKKRFHNTTSNTFRVPALNVVAAIKKAEENNIDPEQIIEVANTNEFVNAV